MQALGHAAVTHPDVWIEGSDAILGEARGSSLLERYIDPEDSRIGDCATDPKATLDDRYKFRILRVQRFGR